MYGLNGCFFMGIPVYFPNVATLGGDTMAERYEQTDARLEQITRSEYQVELDWECHFDKNYDPPRRIEDTSLSPQQSSQFSRCHMRGSNRGNEASLKSKGVDSICRCNLSILCL